MKLSKRELRRRIERLEEETSSRSLTELLLEDTDADETDNTDRETLEELAETAEDLF